PSTLVDDEKGAMQNPPATKCCKAAPPVLEFDAEGNLLRSWGGPGEGYDWPKSEHGIFVDSAANVWLPGNHKHAPMLLKFPGPHKTNSDHISCGGPAGTKSPPRAGSRGGPRGPQPPTPRGPPGPPCPSRGGKRGSAAPPAPRPAASSCSTPPAAPTSGTGAPT